jgi:hypothetical protein
MSPALALTGLSRAVSQGSSDSKVLHVMVHVRTLAKLPAQCCLLTPSPAARRTLAGYQALADECALRCRRLWLTLDARQLSKASRAQLEARSKGWLQLRVASLAEDEGHISDEDAGHEDAAMV